MTTKRTTKRAKSALQMFMPTPTEIDKRAAREEMRMLHNWSRKMYDLLETHPSQRERTWAQMREIIQVQSCYRHDACTQIARRFGGGLHHSTVAEKFTQLVDRLTVVINMTDRTSLYSESQIWNAITDVDMLRSELYTAYFFLRPTR